MSQLSLFYEAPGKQSVQTRPIPEPIPGYLQVRVEAAAVNPMDYKIYDRPELNFIQKYPTVLGADAAGVVTKVNVEPEANGESKFKVGDRITFICTANSGFESPGERGAFQQYALADARFAAKIPENTSYDAAASFPVAGNTAAGALYGQLKFTEPWFGREGAYVGKKLVVLGGSSSVGSYVIQLAVLSGFQVITTSSPTHLDYLKSLGATHVIDRSAPDVTAQILAGAGGPVKYAVDAVSLADTQRLGVEILQPGGRLVLVLRAQPATKAAADAKGIELFGTYGPTGAYRSPEFWDTLEGYFERGVIKFNRITVLPGGLRGWEVAFDLHRQGKVSGTKLVLKPQETQ